ncbi:MAG TPA: TolC family protein [Fusobacterium sp.]|uniref:TolC family protein n=1 Tax=Fusobacterium sp. TaxID=68766 RepID=UPI002F41D14D
MKKYLLLFFCFSFSLLAKEQSLEEMLEKISKNSYEEERYQLQQENLSIKQEHIKQRDFQDGVLASVEYYENHRKGERNAYTKKGSLQWGPFFASTYDAIEKNGDYTSVGVEKNIKDLFYSKYDSQAEQTAWQEKVQFWSYQGNRQKKMISLVQLYRDYKNTLYELEVKHQESKRLKKEEEKLELSYRLGNAKRVDWQAASLGLQNLELELAALKKRKKAHQERFLREFRISMEEDSVEEIPLLKINIEDFMEDYGRAELEEQKAKLKMQEEAWKYSVYEEKIPDIFLRYEHISKNQKHQAEDVISMKLSKKLFSDQYASKIEENEWKEQKLLLQQREEELRAERILGRANYDNYLSQYQMAQNHFQLENSKYEIKKLEYELGKVDYIEVMEAFDKYLESKISLEKARNTLAAYLYEWKIRKVQA